VVFGERLRALIAAEALEAVSVLPEALAGGFAVMAGHGFSLVFWEEKPQTSVGV
jgi:hypothetical protein